MAVKNKGCLSKRRKKPHTVKIKSVDVDTKRAFIYSHLWGSSGSTRKTHTVSINASVFMRAQFDGLSFVINEFKTPNRPLTPNFLPSAKRNSKIFHRVWNTRTFSGNRISNHSTSISGDKDNYEVNSELKCTHTQNDEERKKSLCKIRFRLT